MPIGGGRDVEVKRRLAGEITRVLVDTLDVEPAIWKIPSVRG